MQAFLEKSIRDLSGGEAQIVAIVRSIQLDPTMLLLDEPTASLDRATAEPPSSFWIGGNGGTCRASPDLG